MTPDHSALIELVESRIGQDFDGECHLTEAEARQIAAALRDLTEWRDITTAPDRACMGVVAFFSPACEDWTNLSVGRDERYEMAWFNGTEWLESGTAHSFFDRDPDYRPTHWLPLPSAPNQAKEN